MKRKATMCLMLAGWLVAVIALPAQEARSFRFVSRSIPERGQVKAVEFSLGEKKASIILPKGWLVGSDKGGLVLQSADYGATVSITSQDVVQNPANQVRNNILNQSERVQITSEYEWETRAGKAAVVDAQMAGDEDLRLQCRSFAIPLEGRTLIISMTAAPNSVESVQMALANLIASLRLE